MSSSDPTLEGDQRRLAELEAERRGGLPESFAGEMERHYSPGRTWQSLAVGLGCAPAPGRRARRRLGRRRRRRLRSRPTAARSRASTRATRMIEAAKERLARYDNVDAQVADVHDAAAFGAASFDSVVRVPHADLRRASAAGARRVRPRAAARRPPGALLCARPAPAARDHARPTASATPASRPPSTPLDALRAPELDVVSCDVACREPKKPHFAGRARHRRQAAPGSTSKQAKVRLSSMPR